DHSPARKKKRGRSPPPRTTPDPQGSTMSANTPSRPRRAAAAGLGALALGAALTAAPASAADEHAAEVWLTTADGEQALDRQPDAPFTGDPLPIDIAVDPGERGRPFTGAGASVTEASAHLISGLGALALGAALTAAPASAADEHAAEVWLTTADGEQALDRQPDAPFTGDPLPIDIAVDPGERGRPFTGAGASVTEASAHLIS